MSYIKYVGHCLFMYLCLLFVANSVVDKHKMMLLKLLVYFRLQIVKTILIKWPTPKYAVNVSVSHLTKSSNSIDTSLCLFLFLPTTQQSTPNRETVRQRQAITGTTTLIIRRPPGDSFDDTASWEGLQYISPNIHFHYTILLTNFAWLSQNPPTFTDTSIGGRHRETGTSGDKGCFYTRKMASDKQKMCALEYGALKTAIQ